VKGKTKPVAIHEIMDYHTADTYPKLPEALGEFRDGVQRYRQREWEAASRLFSRVLALNPADKVARIYVERCAHLAANPPADDWAGVWVMENK
jgi:adenylate cyclase